jgi:hypothetical protein
MRVDMFISQWQCSASISTKGPDRFLVSLLDHKQGTLAGAGYRLMRRQRSSICLGHAPMGHHYLIPAVLVFSQLLLSTIKGVMHGWAFSLMTSRLPATASFQAFAANQRTLNTWPPFACDFDSVSNLLNIIYYNMKLLQFFSLLLVALIGVNALYTPDISSLVKRKGGGGGGKGGSSSSGKYLFNTSMRND